MLPELGIVSTGVLKHLRWELLRDHHHTLGKTNDFTDPSAGKKFVKESSLLLAMGVLEAP